MAKCRLCDEEAQKNSKLCFAHDRARLLSASLERIAWSEGLTYDNAENYSEDNYIKLMLERDSG
jgi:hypothetical protein